MNTSDNNQNNPRSLTSLMRDAHLLLDANIEKALASAGSNRRELRLLGRISRGADTQRLEHHLTRPGSLASKFSARGWIEYAEGAWRLTATGSSEYARLQQVVSDTTTAAIGSDSQLERELTDLIEKLGGHEAARAARSERRSRHQRGCHGHGRPEHRGAHPMHGGAPFGEGPRHRGTHRGQRSEYGRTRRPEGAPQHRNVPHEATRFADGEGAPRPQRGYPFGDGGRPFRPNRGERAPFGMNPDALERAIRDLGRGLQPLLPFLGMADGHTSDDRAAQNRARFAERLNEMFGDRSAPQSNATDADPDHSGDGSDGSADKPRD